VSKKFEDVILPVGWAGSSVFCKEIAGGCRLKENFAILYYVFFQGVHKKIHMTSWKITQLLLGATLPSFMVGIFQKVIRYSEGGKSR